MVTQQLQFEFERDRTPSPEGEAGGAEDLVCQVTRASNSTDPIKTVTMEEVVQRNNLKRALKRVRSNKGSPGIDSVTVTEIEGYLKDHWPDIREQLLMGRYKPQPVKQVMIPKPGGGERMLGIPTVLDRLIQQALLQVLTPVYDPTFSSHSYGFRPGRSAQQAVRQAKTYIAEGYEWVVDIDLEKCFDRINHDILMGRIARKVTDKRILRLIRWYLQAGIMVNGVVQDRYEGTPQGGPLSPLLSNILLDELDKELEDRGHKFCRYADDCNVYVRSERAGKRVMDSIERFLAKRLKLKVNRQKSDVARPQERQFLGFSFTSNRWLKIKPSAKALMNVKYRIRKITRRSRGISLLQVIKELTTYLRGWVGYYRLVETPTIFRDLDSWIRRRLRCFVMKQWINSSHARYKGLRSMGVCDRDARSVAASRKGPWALSNLKPAKVAMPNRFFADRGFLSLLNRYESSVKVL